MPHRKPQTHKQRRTATEEPHRNGGTASERSVGKPVPRYSDLIVENIARPVTIMFLLGSCAQNHNNAILG